MIASSTGEFNDAGLRELTGMSAADRRDVLREIFPTYPGGKGGAGVAEKIIRRFPPHSCYVELFLGHGSVLRAKRPSLYSVGVESNGQVVDRWQKAKWPGLTVLWDDGIAFLKSLNEKPTPEWVADTVIYADPPYPLETRTKQELYGEHDWDDFKHFKFLAAAVDCQCSMFISTYDTPWYREMLTVAGFESFKFDAMTRGGMREETVYFRIAATNAGFTVANTAPGIDFRDRERIKRQNTRWINRFRAMPADQRAALLEDLIAANSEGGRR